VVLLILVVLWAAVLGPGFVRRMLERRSGDSIGTFHRNLRVLQRATPGSTRPPGRLAGPGMTVPLGALGSPVPLVTAAGSTDPGDDGDPPVGWRLPGPATRRPELVLMRPGPVTAAPSGSPGAGGGRGRVDPYLRPGACKRRRDVLLWLVCALLGTGVLGAIPQLRVLLDVTAFVGVVTVGYLVLLVRLRRRAVERSAKLRYLPTPEDIEPSIVIRRRAAR